MTKYSVKQINEEVGQGVFAESNINQGDLIFEEEPFVSAQFSWNKLCKYLACDYCMKSLETAEEMAKRLSNGSIVQLPFPDNQIDNSFCVKCEGCNVLYCSVECKKKAWDRYHKVLCPSSNLIDSQGLDQLDEVWRQTHYPPETSTIQIVIRLMAMCRQANDKEEFSRILNSFCNNVSNEHQQINHKLLGEKFEGSLVVLRDMVSNLLGCPEMAGYLDLMGFKHLFALLGTNQQGIGSSSINTWFKSLSEEEQESEAVNQFYEQIENEAGQFLNCEGSGLYVLQSKCNHSCEPNAEISFENGNHIMTLKALKKIEIGEEICISYLDCCELDRSRHSRQKVLRENYLFNCACDKCLEQINDEDVTSDEEMYTDDEDMSD